MRETFHLGDCIAFFVAGAICMRILYQLIDAIHAAKNPTQELPEASEAGSEAGQDHNDSRKK